MHDILAELNPAQREAVSAPDVPVLVVAGAGSGKTRVLTTRVAWLLAEGRAGPGEVLAFTFTNRAAREMRERVERLTVPGRAPRWIGTFHATGARILRRDGLAVGVPPDFSIYDGDDSLRLVKAAMKEAGFDPQQHAPAAARAAISRWKNEGVLPEEAGREAADARAQKLAAVYARYEQALRRNDALDFDDLILRTVLLLEPGAPVQQRYAGRFRHVLVDEFQDTNRLQMVLIKALGQVHGNVFAVGDDDQTIYSWRGACLENMLEFEEVFPGARLVRLEQNYRSTGTILAAANAVIAHNRRRRGKTLWTAGAAGERLRVELALDEEDEAARVSDLIRADLAAGCARADLAVLYRTNAQSRPLEDALRRAGVPYQLVGATAFYERREVRDLLAYLKLIANPRDQVAALRILNVPRRRIGDASAARLAEIAAARGTTLAEAADAPGWLEQALSPAACRRIRAFFAQVAAWRREEPRTTPAELLERIVAETGYLEHLEADDPATAGPRGENVAELINAAHAHVEAAGGGRLAGFLEQVALVADADALGDGEGAVRLMTIHTAKGLEFPVVIVPGCEDGLLPHVSSLDDDAALEEERRLFYVALTRARRRAVLCHARQRRRFGAREACLPSRFLAEIPPALVERGDDGVAAQPAMLTRLLGGPEALRAARAGARARSPARNAGAARTDAASADWRHDISQIEIGFRVGQRVRHPTLGQGVVRRVDGQGDDLMLTIDFSAGRKRLLARFAHLQPAERAGGYDS